MIKSPPLAAVDRASKPRGRKPGSYKRRPPTEGNLLWQEYCEFGVTVRDKFLAELADKAIPYETFIKHSRKDRLLGSIPASNLVIYRDFFLLVTNARIDLYKEIRKQEARQKNEQITAVSETSRGTVSAEA